MPDEHKPFTKGFGCMGELKLYLQMVQDEIVATVAAKGHEDGPAKTVGDYTSLLHEEVTEIYGAYRDGNLDRWVTDENDDRWYVKDKDFQGLYDWEMEIERPEKMRDIAHMYAGILETYPTNMKPEGVPSELADLLIRLLYMAALWEIDIVDELHSKMEFNWTRPYKHGRQH